MEDERKQRMEERRARRKRQVLISRIIILVLVLIIAVFCVILVKYILDKKDKGNHNADVSTEQMQTEQNQTEQGQAGQDQTEQNQISQGQDGKSQTEGAPAGTEAVTEAAAQTGQPAQGDQAVMDEAALKAAMYDYDGAIELLKSQTSYSASADMQKAVTEYESAKAACVEYPLDQVTHVFYHTLIKDPSKAFDGDGNEAGYNQVMTTIDEFNKITQSMYEKGYVLVNLHDMVTFDENGNAVKGKILLPPDKKPFVLSQDDLSYYHYMDGDGFASRLIVDENGQVKNEYIEDDGSVLVGDYDMVPLIDTFVKEHPDFSYHGAKGTIALTGYNGVLGYRTDTDYRDRTSLQEDQQKFLDEHPDFNYDQDVEAAKKVADAMKANGWVFASHTWGHLNVEQEGLEKIKTDTARWKATVEPIVGPTDIIIFAFGADIGSWEGYEGNEKFEYLKSQGFNIYCNVDSSKYWVQFGDNYMRQGRRNLDGYRMYYHTDPNGNDFLDDLFDAESVFDPSRPTPVPEMGS